MDRVILSSVELLNEELVEHGCIAWYQDHKIIITLRANLPYPEVASIVYGMNADAYVCIIIYIERETTTIGWTDDICPGVNIADADLKHIRYNKFPMSVISKYMAHITPRGLVEMVIQIVDYFINIDSKCCVCGKDIEGHSVRPTVCGNDKCVFSAREFGFGTNVVLNKATILMGLMLSDAYNTKTHFNPVPDDMWIENKDINIYAILYKNMIDVVQAMRSNGLKQVKNVRRVMMSAFARNMMKKTRGADTDEIKDANAEDKDDVADELNRTYLQMCAQSTIHLLRWLEITNRSYIQHVPRKEFVQMVGKLCDTKSYINDVYVFRIVVPDDTHRLRFEECLDKSGDRKTLLLYHGSTFGNWHSIMRNGLKNYSRTKYMKHGASFGDGVYFGKVYDISRSYSDGTVCVCEVVEKYAKNHSTCYTCENDGAIIIRYLLIRRSVFGVNKYRE
jgi:hypothetical protein